MDWFENKITETHHVHYSRYIASWINAGGRDFGMKFCDWLKVIGLTQEEIRAINLLAINGKLELEDSARRFLKLEWDELTCKEP